MTIFRLNLDCFLRIVAHCTYAEKVRLERVCHWFRNALRMSYNHRTLNVAAFVNYTREHIYTDDQITAIIVRVAPFARHISFGCKLLKITESVAEALCL